MIFFLSPDSPLSPLCLSSPLSLFVVCSFTPLNSVAANLALIYQQKTPTFPIISHVFLFLSLFMLRYFPFFSSLKISFSSPNI